MIRRRRKPLRLGARRRPVNLGRAGRLGDVDSYGPTQSVTLVVGLNKGKAPQNQTSTCSRKPPEFSPKAVDSMFIKARAAAVGRSNVGATRSDAKGWYQGDPEQSVRYDVIFIPNDKESTYDQFLANMKRTAESMAKGLCQDEVIIVSDRAGKKETYSASCPRRGSCRGR